MPPSLWRARNIASRSLCELLTECMPRARHKRGVLAPSNHMLERLRGPWVVGLKAELMGRHSPNSRARVNQHPLNERSHDIDGERTNFAPLASQGMHGMPADQRRCISKSEPKWLAATLISKVIHQGNACSPHPGPRMQCARDKRRDGCLPLAKKLVVGFLSSFPRTGIKVAEVSLVSDAHSTGRFMDCPRADPATA